MGKIEFIVDKNTTEALAKALAQSNSILMKEIIHLETIKYERNLNTLQNSKNANTTLLYSHDHFYFSRIITICSSGEFYQYTNKLHL